MKENMYRRLFVDFIFWGNKIVYSDYEDILCQLDIVNHKVDFFTQLKWNDSINRGSHIEKIYYVSDWIILIDVNGDDVYIFDILKKEWFNLKIDCNEKLYGNYIGVIAYKNFIYIIPKYKNCILKVDLRNKKYISEEYQFSALINKNETIICAKEEYVYFFGKNNETVWIYNIKDGKSKAEKWNYILGNIACVKNYEGEFWILEDNGKLIVWNDKRSEMREIIKNPICNNIDHCFGEFTITDKNIWLLPSLGDDIYIFDKESEAVTKYNNYPEDYYNMAPKNWGKFLVCHRHDNRIYYGMHSGNYMLSIDMATGKEEWIFPFFPDDKDVLKYFIENKQMCKEFDGGLNNFLQCILERQ